MRRATGLISSGPATDVPPYFCTTVATRGRLPASRVQAEACVRVRVECPEGGGELADAEQAAGDPAACELGRALGVLEPERSQAGACERPEVRPQRVHVLVDP